MSVKEWTGEAVSKMHIYGISQTELAQKIGKSREWVCRVLNGKETPKEAPEVFMSAINEIISARG